MRWTFISFAAALLAIACHQGPATSPTELARPEQVGPSPFWMLSASSFTAFEDPLDDPEDAGLCARSGGFWCQNQNGQNPNLTSEEWEVFLADAVRSLGESGVATSADEVAEAVCDVRRQLFRQLASLALNLAAGFVDPNETLTGEDADIGTVQDAFELGAQIYTLGDAVPFDERQAIKDTMDRINNNESHANECALDDEDLPEQDEDAPGACGVQGGGVITICHISPGNPAARHTITIGAPAWPAHEAHGDTCGPC